MPTSIIDSIYYADMYGSERMHALFSDQARFQGWLDFEAGLARAQARLGIIPQAAADEITALGNDSHGILLARATSELQTRCIGNQTGGRVAFFLETDDFLATHARFTQRGVDFTEAPRQEPYGMVAVFKDIFGNRWDLIEPRN